eukprot:CAMPEP_0180517198 /NCGR_PEP_ID=MMETSP1036_2-20121128/54387_1 /TAXON_ID=632150 /ORGANISM="Azadinium spinosum, Strain 3D9" /LENGTH=38 /DNA_ID= /DNA_START= /DNA_END= /DNA_ORIENTATION=
MVARCMAPGHRPLGLGLRGEDPLLRAAPLAHASQGAPV